MTEHARGLGEQAGQTKPWVRQAVVLCHGIGEHVPMETLTNFVWTINRNKDSEADPPPKDWAQQLIFRSYPQDMADNLELRAFTALESSDRVTDYYELYWSHLKARENIGRVFLKWLGGILKIDRVMIPDNLARAFTLLVWLRRLLILLAAALVAAIVALVFVEPGLVKKTVTAGLIVIAPLIVVIYRYRLPDVINIIGDIARYLSVMPENIASRQAIRKAGIDLINRLHEAREANGDIRYGRIIVVGHSLGSIIAYDVILNCFAQRNGYAKIEDWLRLSKDGKTLPLDGTQFASVAEDGALEKLRNSADALRQAQDRLSIDKLANAFAHCEQPYHPKSYPDDAQLQEQQKAFWKTQRALFENARTAYAAAPARPVDESKRGLRYLDWRVSDFVTLGSPLTYAAILLARFRPPDASTGSTELEKRVSREDFCAKLQNDLTRARRCERNWPLNGELEYAMSIGILPTAPPRPFHVHEDKGPLFYFAIGNQRVALTNNSPFALTRWTNLYYPCGGRLLSGDIISGPLGPVFGLGIKDIPLDAREISWRRHYHLGRERLAHTYYWNESRTDWKVIDGLEGAPAANAPLRRSTRIAELLRALDLERRGEDWPENADKDEAATPVTASAAATPVAPNHTSAAAAASASGTTS